MSEEQLKAFLAKANSDTALQEQLKAEGADVVAIARAAGFSISAEDLNAYSQSLSDDELEAVAGGLAVGITGWQGCGQGGPGCGSMGIVACGLPGLG